jgi:hypothetical protein
MRLEFLCPHHRCSLLRDPAAAERLWSASLAAPPASPEPTPRDVRTAGAGLQAAGIYLQTRRRCDRVLLDRYASSALHLAALLTRLGQTRLAVTVIALAHATVEQLVLAQKAPASALAVCRRLHREGTALVGEPASAPGPAVVNS